MVSASATPCRPFARAQAAATLAGLAELDSDPKENQEEEETEMEMEEEKARSGGGRNDGDGDGGDNAGEGEEEEDESPPELPQLPPEGGGRAAAADPAFLDRLHRLERHIRSGKLRLTCADELGRAAAAAAADAASASGGGGGGTGTATGTAAAAAASASSSSSTNSARVKTQARRLAFYLFWNVCGDVTR